MLQNELKIKGGAENKRDKNRRVVRREQNMCKIGWYNMYYNFKYYLRTSKKKGGYCRIGSLKVELIV
jgi:hypothetical protein